MEHSKNRSSNDDRWAAALREMGREQSLVTQLRAVVLPALQLAGGDHANFVAGMFHSILDSSAKAIAEIKLLRPDRSCDDDAAVDDKRRVRKISSGDCDGNNDKPNPQRLMRRRRLLPDDSVTLETPVPDYDGHQWRKYGQKVISNAKHQRSYYKCTYMKEQGCRATKTVQQQQEDGGADELAMYAVVYYGEHTCKPGVDTLAAAIVETGSTGNSSGGGTNELARTYSQCSNISVTCTSVVVDHPDQHHHRTASVESSYDLLDMAEDLADGQLLDVAGFSPLDLDSDWATEMQMLMGS